MQNDYYFGEDIIGDGTSDATFVIVSTNMTIGVHPTKDGPSTTMLTFGIDGGISSISVYATFISMDQKKTMNNISSIIVFIY
jgi:hypothetical protein